MTSDASSPDVIKTRFLIISDTHGEDFQPHSKPTMHADVAIHCGDLTEDSKLDEFRSSLKMLQEISAPLKLVIAGNHDFTMDLSVYKSEVAEVSPSLDPVLVQKIYGEPGDARQIFEDAKDAGIVFLDKGTHRFVLCNGAVLNVFACPWTPSLYPSSFQYQHWSEFSIPTGVDVVITHGPPQGILDYTDSRERAGCSTLFADIARARPRLHCFGHVHESWGAKLVTWKDHLTESPSHFTDIDNSRSVVIDKLSNYRPSRFDTPELKEEKLERESLLRQERCRATSHCPGDVHPLIYGLQTLFVNASIEGAGDSAQNVPWLVDLELPRST